jgi:hypothetical protein
MLLSVVSDRPLQTFQLKVLELVAAGALDWIEIGGCRMSLRHASSAGRALSPMLRHGCLMLGRRERLTLIFEIGFDELGE